MITKQLSGAQRPFEYPVFQVKSFFKFGRTMNQEITCRLALDRPGFGPRADRMFCGEQIGTGDRFSSEHYSFPLS
jgi:hypothetical protein